ncbi:MAG: transposase [Oscillospiraceae bacterium]|nr:transposase [Oscillospiraceae bacterium]
MKDYDYATNAYYYLTVCTKNRECILSEISVDKQSNAVVKLTPYGEIAESFLRSIPGIDKYVIMPNHIHMIIHKTNGKSLVSDIRSFKGLTTKKIGKSIWQNYYYDHIIRDEEDYLIKWNYIDSNPGKWSEDEYNP